jgi:hypothetical protein
MFITELHAHQEERWQLSVQKMTSLIHIAKTHRPPARDKHRDENCFIHPDHFLKSTKDLYTFAATVKECRKLDDFH